MAMDGGSTTLQRAGPLISRGTATPQAMAWPEVPTPMAVASTSSASSSTLSAEAASGAWMLANRPPARSAVSEPSRTARSLTPTAVSMACTRPTLASSRLSRLAARTTASSTPSSALTLAESS
ncbi:Uncharacterised protein [Bordetella pertussis]|nr:Uncharacterised protein [Bordetella pertussis]